MAFLAYLGVSFVLYGLPVLAHFSTWFVGDGSADAQLYVWDLAWWPHALLHGLNPFHSGYVWAPSGVNMAWVTGLPGPALVAFPITRVFGGVFASNVLAVLAPAFGGWAAFLLCREVTGRFYPSLAGAYLYGFSTYEVGQMHGHMNLFLTFPVPLAVYLVVRYVRGSLPRRRFVWLLAAVLVAEFSISTEVFATMTFFAAIALGGALAFVPELRVRTRELLVLIGLAYALAAIPLAPYLWYATRNVPPALANGIGGTSIDVLSFFVPRTETLLGGPWLASFTRGFAPNVSEDGAYLGPIFLGLLAYVLATGWRDRTTRLVFGFAGIAVLLSLGGILRVRGRRTILLPWRIFEHVPVLKDALPARFTLYLWLAVAVIVARWLAERAPKLARAGMLPWATVGFAAITLLPNVFVSHLHRTADVPPFFADGTFARYVSPGETILILHAPKDDGEEMLWQGMTGFAFRMPQGYTGPEPASFANDAVWQNMKAGGPFGVTANQLEGWLRAHDVGTVVVTNDVASRWRFLLSAVTDGHPKPVGGVQLYLPPGGASQLWAPARSPCGASGACHNPEAIGTFE